jgi:hypothetical protein
VLSFHTLAEVTKWSKAAGFEVTSVSYAHAGALLNFEIHASK